MKRNTTKKGFTLIELLAVIVILAIIALIAVPVILNIIDKANKNAFKDTAYGIISAGELYFAEQQLDLEGMTGNKTFSFPSATGLELKGKLPESGSMTVNTEGKVSLSISNGRYCVTKGFDDKDVTVTEDVEECKSPGESEPIMTSKNTCVTSGICSQEEINAGILVNVKVNKEKNYNFYVIKDTGSELTLIMDRNLESNIEWINAEHYSEANIDLTSCTLNSCNDEGPITAVRTLKERTSGWTNIPEKEYTYSDDSLQNQYSEFTETMRARMITYKEINEIKAANGTIPEWLYINLYTTGLDTDANGNSIYGYWTSTPTSTYQAIYLYFSGYVNTAKTDAGDSIGLRPVITITK